MIRLCDYGCGGKGIFLFKNGKYCCCNDFKKCIGYRKYLSNLRKGKPSPHKGKKRNYSFEARKKMGDSKRGKSVWNSNLKNCFSEETLLKMKRKRPNYIPWNKGKKGFISHSAELKEKVRQRMLNGGSKVANLNNQHYIPSEKTKKKISLSNTGKKRSQEWKDVQREKCLNGLALKMIKGIKKISNEEIKLLNLVKELYPDCINQYPVFNYSLDIALVDLKIAIEFDGYYHFNCQENIDYHKQRQEKIEKEGWKFYRITMFDKFPSLEEIKTNIEKLI